MSRVTVVVALLALSTAFAPVATAVAPVALADGIASADGVEPQSTQPAASLSGPTERRGPPGGTAVNGSDRSSRDAATTDGAVIVGVYPNPVADGDRGEFVVVRVPDGGNASYRIGDDEKRVAVPNGTSGTVAVTAHPALVRNLTATPVVGVAAFPSLANGGERLALARGNDTVATARYREAPEGEVGRFDDRGVITWEPVGTTDRPVVTAGRGAVRAFVLPDAPDVAVEAIRAAEDRVLLAGYTFTSARVARALERAADRGVSVHVLLEGEPVDGISRREARLLDSLVANGVTVELLGGARDRYAYHHAKYAVVDGRAVVLTENWKPSGTGGASSRGWGVVVAQRDVVAGLVETFRADADWPGAHDWRRFRRGRTFASRSVANGSFPRNHDPATVPVNRTRLFVTPDNAGSAVTDVIRNATESIDVIQMSIDGPDQRFLRAAVDAARRGVDVRILLSGAWYVREDNRRLVERLRDRAGNEDLPLDAKLAAPGGRFEKIHAKGVVVDGDQVLVGSLNWNGESIRRNREVMVLLDGRRVGAYYADVFEQDWRGDRAGSSPSSLPVGSILAVAGVLLLAVLVVRRVDFADDTGVNHGDGETGVGAGVGDRETGFSPTADDIGVDQTDDRTGNDPGETEDGIGTDPGDSVVPVGDCVAPARDVDDRAAAEPAGRQNKRRSRGTPDERPARESAHDRPAREPAQARRPRETPDERPPRESYDGYGPQQSAAGHRCQQPPDGDRHQEPPDEGRTQGSPDEYRPRESADGRRRR